LFRGRFVVINSYSRDFRDHGARKHDRSAPDVEEYNDVAARTRDVISSVEGHPDVIISALIHVAVEMAFSARGPEEGREQLIAILAVHFDGCAAAYDRAGYGSTN
jgi:hypothetical protein